MAGTSKTPEGRTIGRIAAKKRKVLKKSILNSTAYSYCGLRNQDIRSSWWDAVDTVIKARKIKSKEDASDEDWGALIEAAITHHGFTQRVLINAGSEEAHDHLDVILLDRVKRYRLKQQKFKRLEVAHTKAKRSRQDSDNEETAPVSYSTKRECADDDAPAGGITIDLFIINPTSAKNSTNFWGF